MCRQTNNKGFTLAEVLVTLAIIGIVAALTIPTLINSTQENKYKSGFKKNFRNINQAAIQIKEDYGSLNHAINNNSTTMRTVFCSQLNCLKQYGWNSQGNCSSALVSEFDGSTSTGSDRPCAILSDGTTLNFNWGADALHRYIEVDTNGKNPPNTWGLDVFLIQFELDERVLPAGYQGGYYQLDIGNGKCVKNTTGWYIGYSCAYKVLTGIDY